MFCVMHAARLLQLLPHEMNESQSSTAAVVIQNWHNSGSDRKLAV